MSNKLLHVVLQSANVRSKNASNLVINMIPLEPLPFVSAEGVKQRLSFRAKLTPTTMSSDVNELVTKHRHMVLNISVNHTFVSVNGRRGLKLSGLVVEYERKGDANKKMRRLIEGFDFATFGVIAVPDTAAEAKALTSNQMQDIAEQVV